MQDLGCKRFCRGWAPRISSSLYSDQLQFSSMVSVAKKASLMGGGGGGGGYIYQEKAAREPHPTNF